MLPILVIVVAAGLLVGMAVGIYNTLVRLRNAWKAAFAQIDVALKRRHDLIPNLVETAKGYMSHERQTLEAVISARGAAVSARTAATANPSAASLAALSGAEGQLGAVLGRLFALAEAYPDLKANQNFMQLQEEITSTENKISFARQFFNDSTMGYNTHIETFPTNILAGMFGFVRREFFEVKAETERTAPTVKF